MLREHGRIGAVRHDPARQLELLDVTDVPFDAARAGSVLASSASAGSHGVLVEWHRLQPQELPEHSVPGHELSICKFADPSQELSANRGIGADASLCCRG